MSERIVKLKWPTWPAEQAMKELEGGAFIVGKTKSGKNVLLRYILSLFPKRFHYVMAMTGSGAKTDDLDFMPKSCIHDGVDEDAIRNFVQLCADLKTERSERGQDIERRYQRGEISEEQANAELWRLENEYSPNLVIIDDCSENREKVSGPTIKALYSKGRHNNILTIIMMHDTMNVYPYLRKQTQMLWAYAAEESSSKVNLHKQFCDVFGPGAKGNRDFEECFDGIVSTKYTCMVVDKRAEVEAGKKRIYGFRSPPEEAIPPFYIGHPDLWATHNEYYNPDWEKANGGALKYDPEMATPMGMFSSQGTKGAKKATIVHCTEYSEPSYSPPPPAATAPAPKPDPVSTFEQMIPHEDMDMLVAYQQQHPEFDWATVLAEYAVRRGAKRGQDEAPWDTIARFVASCRN